MTTWYDIWPISLQYIMPLHDIVVPHVQNVTIRSGKSLRTLTNFVMAMSKQNNCGTKWQVNEVKGWTTQISWTNHLRATECHLPYVIMQCYLPPNTTENKPCLNPSQTGWYLIDLLLMHRRLSWAGCWLDTETVYLSAIQVGHGVEQLRWSRPTC